MSSATTDMIGPYPGDRENAWPGRRRAAMMTP
jgi:hypothetical protein